jgi:hypothetical protein
MKIKKSIACEQCTCVTSYALHFVNSCTGSLVHSIVHNSNCEVSVVNFHDFHYKMSEMFGELGPKFPQRLDTTDVFLQLF